jgi:hypothetical protein
MVKQLWDLRPWNLVDEYQCFKEYCCFHFQGRSWDQHVPPKCWYYPKIHKFLAFVYLSVHVTVLLRSVSNSEWWPHNSFTLSGREKLQIHEIWWTESWSQLSIFLAYLRMICSCVIIMQYRFVFNKITTPYIMHLATDTFLKLMKHSLLCKFIWPFCSHILIWTLYHCWVHLVTQTVYCKIQLNSRVIKSNVPLSVSLECTQNFILAFPSTSCPDYPGTHQSPVQWMPWP